MMNRFNRFAIKVKKLDINIRYDQFYLKQFCQQF